MVLAILIIAASAVFITVIWLYFFSIYEVRYVSNPDKLTTDASSSVEITAIPINSFGVKAIFRQPHTDFFIEEGGDLIDYEKFNNENRIVKLKSKGKAGKVTLILRSKHSLNPAIIVVPVVEKIKGNIS